MPRKILLKLGNFEAKAILLDAPNPKTAETVWKKLPIEGKAERWGEEIYFFVPFNIAPEHGKQVVAEGDIAFWPEGPAIAIFFGKTPLSRGKEPVAYSPVNVFAKLEKIEKERLGAVKSGTKITLEKATEQ